MFALSLVEHGLLFAPPKNGILPWLTYLEQHYRLKNRILSHISIYILAI
jgi:hypothetical protein